MLTTNELRGQLAAEVESAPVNVDRTSQVRRRVSLRRRRRAIGTGVASVAALAVAALVLVPQLSDDARTVPPAGPNPSATADTPLPQYHLGGSLVAEAERVGSTAFTVPFDTSDGGQLIFTIDCYLPGASSDIMVTLAVGSIELGGSSCSDVDDFVGANSFTPDPETFSDILAGPQTLTVSFKSPVTATSRVRVGIYQKVPLDRYQFPPTPSPLPALEPIGNLDPTLSAHPLVLLSAGPLPDESSVVVGPRGTWSGTFTITKGLTVEGQTVAPGTVTVSVHGNVVDTFSGWDYTNSGWGGGVTLEDLGIASGDKVTITVTADRFPGDSWALLLSDEDPDPSS